MSATARAPESVGPVLVATKLHVPEVQRGLVSRGKLVDRLVAEDGRRLTLVCAPAGWGKTVLLSEWHARAEETRPFAWVSLDGGDGDPVRFWGYVIGALRRRAGMWAVLGDWWPCYRPPGRAFSMRSSLL